MRDMCPYFACPPASFRDPQRASRRWHECFDHLRTDQSLLPLVEDWRHRLLHSDQPDILLDHFMLLASPDPEFRTTLLHTVVSRSELLELIGTMAEWSRYLCELAHRRPRAFLAALQRLQEPLPVLRRAEVLQQGRQQAADDRLAYFRATELLLIGLHDLRGSELLPLYRSLTTLAECLFAVAYEQSTAELDDRWGRPCLDSGSPSRFAVLGCGKLGSGELSYGSDLDIIFICEGHGRCPNGRDGESYWTKAAQGMITRLMEPGFFEVDARLRPWGEQGDLVPSISGLRRYWAQSRELWERMAMTRIAPVAGDPEFGAECVALLRHAVLTEALPPDAPEQVRHMRAMLQATAEGKDSIKRGVGGTVDIEFIAHFLSLGCDPQVLPAGAAVEYTLLALAMAGRLDQDDAVVLMRALRLLRRIEARLRFACGRATSSLPADPAERTRLATRCGFADLSEFEQAVCEARDQARCLFIKYI